jgi:hypothetical protein
MEWLDDLVNAGINAGKTVVETVGSVVTSAADAVQSTVTAASDVVDQVVDSAAGAAQTVLDSSRGWVDDNWGDTLLGNVGRGVIDALKIGTALVEFGIHFTTATTVLIADVTHDIVTGNLSNIPNRFDAFGSRVEGYWQEAVEEMNTFAIESSNLGRNVPGVKNLYTKSWSVAAGLKLTNKGQPDPRTYQSTGKRYEFSSEK